MNGGPTTKRVSKNSEFKKQITMEGQNDLPTKTIIVQGFPVDNSINENSAEIRIFQCKLESLFSCYGILEMCVLYKLWYDSFAQITFASRSSAIQAYAAAANRQIRMGESILTVTLLAGDKAPIEKLNDHCLMKVFSLLENHDKLNLEKVCKRWRDVARRSWYNVKNFDGVANRSIFKDCLLRCGRYLDNLSFSVNTADSLSLVKQHCQNVKNLTIFDFDRVDLDKLCSLLENLRKLKRFALYICTHLSRDVVVYLPEFMEEILILPNIPIHHYEICSQDFSKLHELQKLVLSGIVLGNTTINGLQTLTNLTHLDINNGGSNTTIVMQIPHLSNLKSLAISHYPINDSAVQEIVMSNRHLEVVDISYITSLTDVSLRAISLLVNLKSLKMKNLPNVTLTRMDVMPNLEYLNCDSCSSVSEDQLLTIIASSPLLSVLSVVLCNLTNEFFAAAAMSTKGRDNNIALKIFTNQRVSLSRQYPLLIIEEDFSHNQYFNGNYYYENTSEDSDAEIIEVDDWNEWWYESNGSLEDSDSSEPSPNCSSSWHSQGSSNNAEHSDSEVSNKSMESYQTDNSLQEENYTASHESGGLTNDSEKSVASDDSNNSNDNDNYEDSVVSNESAGSTDIDDGNSCSDESVQSEDADDYDENSVASSQSGGSDDADSINESAPESCPESNSGDDFDGSDDPYTSDDDNYSDY